MRAVAGHGDPAGVDQTFGTVRRGRWPRSGSGVGATVIFVGAVWSATPVRPGPVPARLRPSGGRQRPHRPRDTVILASGGLLQGFVGHDEAFAVSLAVGITVIYAGFRGRGEPRAPDRAGAQPAAAAGAG